MAAYNISAKALERLGYYVYLLMDPRNQEVFYVGKGTGARCLTHLEATGQSAKARRIRRIRGAGAEPQIDILVHGLRDEQTALKVEAAAIDLLGKEHLANLVRGHETRRYGRRDLHDLLADYNPDRVTITEPALLIRINQLYRPDMSEVELYDATRGVWRTGAQSPKRQKALYALAIYKGIVREVYEITAWFKAGATFSTRDPKGYHARDRYEFVGRVASEALRQKYGQKAVGHYFPKNSQSPLIYVNCG